MAKLSELDYRILKILLQDGRASYDWIAEECGQSKNKIWKRCRAMEENGIIKGATVQIDFGHFGYVALATMLISVEAQWLAQAMEEAKKMGEVRAYRQYNSVYNIRAVATLWNLNELDHIKQLIRRHLPTLGIKTYIWAGVRNMPENMNLAGVITKSNQQPEEPHLANIIHREIKVDTVDRRIVEKLSANGRASFSSIAKELGLSTDTVVKRVQKLMKSGVMKTSIQIDPKALGYNFILDFNIAFTTSYGLTENVFDALSKIPDVIIITKTSGDFDLHVSAMVRNSGHSFAIQDQITKVSGITKMEASARELPDGWPTPLQHISTF